MSDSRLLPCPSCSRHVRAFERRCPHCTSALPETFASRSSARVPNGRLSRAALFAFGLGSATAAVAAVSTACGGETEETPIENAAYGGPPVDMVDAAYGGPPADGATDSSPPMLDAAYGGPPVDGSFDAPVLVDAAYGGPPVDGG